MHKLLPKPVCGSMEEKKESAKLEKGSSQQGSYRSNLGGSCQREFWRPLWPGQAGGGWGREGSGA